MKTIISLLAAALTASASFAADSAQSNVNVQFVNNEHYTDVSVSGMGQAASQKIIFSQIRDHIQELANRYLKKGQTLDIRITDIDMAGEFEPWRGPRWDDIRILKDIYPPRINFQYTLTSADGTVLKQGKERLLDANYLMNSLHLKNDEAYYEEQLFDDWFRDTLG